MSINGLGYVRIAMQDPQEWVKVGCDILGFTSTTSEDGSVRLRLDEAPFRYLVERSDNDGFVCAGWECSAGEFSGLVERLRATGAEVQEGDPAGCAARSVGRGCTPGSIGAAASAITAAIATARADE